MKKVVGGLIYDTQHSALAAITDTGISSQRLYRTKTGHWFLVFHNPGLDPVDELYVLDQNDAIAQYDKLLLKNPKLNPKERY